MKVWRNRMLHVAGACISCLLLLQGCSNASSPSGGSSPGGTDELTDLEQQAVVAASNAPGAMAMAIDVVDDSTGDLADDGGLLKSTREGPPDVTFGTCPEVSKAGSLRGDGLELTVDFGQEPCTVPTFDEDFTYVCAGSASGTFGVVDQGVSLEFNSIGCNEQELDGTVDLSYDLLLPGVALEGDWDLTWYPGDEAVGTVGSGSGSYVPVTGGCCDVTSITTFDGSVTNEGLEWSIVVTDILISLEKYASFIPYSGSIAVDGPDIRAITISFNENSPATGEISISIENGPSFSTDLYELEQWAEMILGE